MKKIVALMVAAMMTLSFSMIAVASEVKGDAEKVEKADKKDVKKDSKKEKKAEKKEEAKPAKKGKREVSGC